MATKTATRDRTFYEVLHGVGIDEAKDDEAFDLDFSADEAEAFAKMLGKASRLAKRRKTVVHVGCSKNQLQVVVTDPDA